MPGSHAAAFHACRRHLARFAEKTRSVIWAIYIAGAPMLWADGQTRELRLGHFSNLTHAQALYARAGGQFEKKMGIPIKWTSFNAGPTAIEAMFGDALDATFVGPSPAINGFVKSKGKKFVIIAGAASGGTGLVVRKDSGIRSVRDFDGKIIATPQLGNTQDVAARDWFTRQGYRLREKGGTLTLLPLSNADQLTLFLKREIDGAWTVEPWLTRLELEGGGQLFVNEDTLWPDGRHVTTHLIMNRDFLAGNPALVKNLLAALVEITQEINADKVAAAGIIGAELKKETGKALPEAVFKHAMARLEFTWDPVGASLHKSAATAHRLGLLRASPELPGIYSLGLLNEVLLEKHQPPVAE